MSEKVQTNTLYKNWKPLKHRVVKDSALREQLHIRGYAVIPFIDRDRLNALRELYEREHSIKSEGGAMFYTLYSKDHAYRKRVHQNIQTILEPVFENHFTGYKNIVNIFINKISGPASGFYTHQDTTALDEFNYSPLSIWIPLQDITPQNGALGVIEKSHWFFSPYRGVSFSFPFSKINDTVKNYLQPVYLKAGEAIVFDPRIVHNSFPNTSGEDRLVALCGIFPEEAGFIACYKDKAPGSKIELIKQPDSFILENDNFYYDCHSRPKGGTLIGTVEEDFPAMSKEGFEYLCAENNIQKNNADSESYANSNFIAEPDGKNSDTGLQCEHETPKNLWGRLKTVFYRESSQ